MLSLRENIILSRYSRSISVICICNTMFLNLIQCVLSYSRTLALKYVAAFLQSQASDTAQSINFSTSIENWKMFTRCRYIRMARLALKKKDIFMLLKQQNMGAKLRKNEHYISEATSIGYSSGRCKALSIGCKKSKSQFILFLNSLQAAHLRFQKKQLSAYPRIITVLHPSERSVGQRYVPFMIFSISCWKTLQYPLHRTVLTLTTSSMSYTYLSMMQKDSRVQ